MPDWNPDREGHVDHEYIVQDATRDRIPGVQTQAGFLKFNKQGRMKVKDPALAAEIRSSEIGKRKVTVTRVRHPKPSDQGHRYFFGGWPEMPWKKKQEVQESET